MNSIWAVVPAAGSGRRLGGEIPKQYREIAGAPLMEHTLRALLESPDIRGVVVALDPSDRRADAIESLSDVRVQTTPGGAERADSVMAGLELLASQATEEDWVLVHDAARPCLPLEALTALVERARLTGEGAILAEPVADTLKQVDDAGSVAGTVDRASLWRAQTPQLFPLFPLRAALGQCFEEGVSVTDEAMAMEYVGQPVHVVEGPSSNIKVTVEADLAFADLVLRKRGAQ
ncbi:MAG: 2-C-methyl-D-erythritol 4-phosphate cytidylyltransferase [Congregibacter sp.]|nr:2-C-methyl-D-erythritol 4-phosphate cytidylyltransferase [Congregibacter sp.]